MDNQKKNNKNNETNEDVRFLDYRLTQLENKLEKGLDTLEQEQRRYNIEVMKTLQSLQQGQSKTHETIAQLQQRQTHLEEKMKCIDKLKDAASKNTERNKHTNQRIDVIQKILILVGGAAISAVLGAIWSILQILLLK